MLKMSYLAAAITAFLFMVGGAIVGDRITGRRARQLDEQIAQLESELKSDADQLEMLRVSQSVRRQTAETFSAAYIQSVARDMKSADHPIDTLDHFFTLVGEFASIDRQLQQDESWAADGGELRLAVFEASRNEFISPMIEANADRLFKLLRKARRQAVRMGIGDEFDRHYEEGRSLLGTTVRLRLAAPDWSVVEAEFKGATR